MSRTFGLVIVASLVLGAPQVSFGKDCLLMISMAGQSGVFNKAFESRSNPDVVKTMRKRGWVKGFQDDYLDEVGKILKKLESDPSKKDQLSNLRAEIERMKKSERKVSREKKHGSFAECKHEFKKFCSIPLRHPDWWGERSLLAIEGGNKISLIICDNKGMINEFEVELPPETSNESSPPKPARSTPALQ